MSRKNQRFKMIGMAFDVSDLESVSELLSEKKFHFGAEGGRVGGYEIYVSSDLAEEAASLIRDSHACRTGDLFVFLFNRWPNFSKLVSNDKDGKYLEWREQCMRLRDYAGEL